MSDIMFNGRTYAENLDYISSGNVDVYSGGAEGLGWGVLLKDALNQELAGTGKSLNGFFAQFNENNIVDGQNRPTKKPLPKTWEEFIRAFRRDYIGDSTPLPPESSANQTFSQALSVYQGVSSLVDFQVFLTAENVSPDFASQMKNAFADFLQNYPFKTNGSVGTADEFFKNMMEYFGITATVFEGGYTEDYVDGAIQFVYDAVASYEKVFESFPAPTEVEYTNSGVPQPHDPSFQEKFVEFYQAYVAEHGYFSSGRAFNEWVKKTQTEYELGQRNNHPVPVPGYNGPSRVVTLHQTEKVDQLLFDSLPIPAFVNGISVVSNVILQGTISNYDETEDSLSFDQTYSGVTININPNGFVQINIDVPSPTENDAIAAANYVNEVLQSLRFTSTAKVGAAREVPLSRFWNLDGFFNLDEITATVEIGTGVTIVNTSVTTDASARVFVLNRVFKLIAEFIDVLQEVAAAQAEYLTFLTEWQKAYTDLISQIKTFTRNDGTIFGYSDADTDTTPTLNNERSDANTFNLNLRERLSNLRGIVSDTAKREQSRINQSQDASTQQGQFGTSIIQQFATILGSIYR